jgi:hypothetical protein
VKSAKDDANIPTEKTSKANIMARDKRKTNGERGILLYGSSNLFKEARLRFIVFHVQLRFP